MYFVAAVAVVFDRFRGRQRHYIGHSEDIQCLTIHPSNELCATGQKEGRGRIGLAQVHVWDLETMTTQVVIGLNDAENGIAALAFSNRNGGQHLMVVDDSDEHVLAVWSWRSRRLIARTIVNQSKVTGGRFIPKDDMQVVTFGESHLTVWTRQKDSTFDRDDLIGEEDGKVITCLEFDEDGTRMMVGDTDGNVTVWSDERSGAYQHYRVFQAQMRAVSCLLLLYDGTLLSAGGSERDRFIKAWDSNHNYRPLMSNRLPESAGGIRSMCPQKLDATDNNIYVGTSKNVIVEGSVNRRFKIVVQGHHKELAALAVDPDEAAFVTAGHDRCISRWVMHKLVWRVQVENECLALSVHPAGDVVAVGTADGHIIILTLPRGMHVATLPASKHAITCMAYNPDGTMLGCGLEEGSLVLYHSSNRGFSYRKSKLLKGLGDALVQMDWSRDSKCIQSVSTDYEQILWDIPVMEIEKIPSTLRDVAWQGITCTLTYSVHGIWNNRNQTVDATHTTCCSSASGKLLAAGDNEGYIRLFRYPCISPRADFYEVKGQSSPVQCVRFLYDDSFLITVGGYDGTLMQWMLVSAK